MKTVRDRVSRCLEDFIWDRLCDHSTAWTLTEEHLDVRVWDRVYNRVWNHIWNDVWKR